MTTLPRFIASLASNPGPVLTVYSEERVEFNGPVLARWCAKIANLLGSELAADLFGFDDFSGGAAIDEGGAGSSPDGEDGAPTLFLRHGLWQSLVWALPARAMGWRVVSLDGDSSADPDAPTGAAAAPSGVAAPGDALVVDRVDDLALDALADGAWVLAQPREYLAFSWRGETLPEGVLDALAEVMAQSDALEVEIPSAAPSMEALAGLPSPVPSVPSSRVLLRIDEGATAVEVMEKCLGHWLAGSSVVLVDGARYSPEDTARIGADEGARRA